MDSVTGPTKSPDVALSLRRVALGLVDTDCPVPTRLADEIAPRFGRGRGGASTPPTPAPTGSRFRFAKRPIPCLAVRHDHEKIARKRSSTMATDTHGLVRTIRDMTTTATDKHKRHPDDQPEALVVAQGRGLVSFGRQWLTYGPLDGKVRFCVFLRRIGRNTGYLSAG